MVSKFNINDFNKCFKEITARNKLPVLCGGSGLYIEAALKEYTLPDIPENKKIRSELDFLPKEKLADLLKSESAEIYNKTDLSSSRRIIRGIEIAKYIKSEKTPLLNPVTNNYRPLILGINLPREEIIRRIDIRLENRLKEGMLEEVEHLIRNGLSIQRLIKLGLEYRYCAMYINNEIQYEVMIDKLKTEIHRFAKRQMTWFRGMERRGLHIHWIDGNNPGSALKIIKETGFI